MKHQVTVPPMNFNRLSWEDFDTAVNHISSLFYGMKQPEAIYGEPRGGTCLAVALSHRMGIPLVTSLLGVNNVLWVDDIMEKGNALRKAKAAMEGRHANYVVWVVKEPTCDCLYAEVISGDDWLVFPWESIEAATKDAEEYHARSE